MCSVPCALLSTHRVTHESYICICRCGSFNQLAAYARVLWVFSKVIGEVREVRGVGEYLVSLLLYVYVFALTLSSLVLLINS